jgi:hypothetical protein
METKLDHEGKKLTFRRIYGATGWPGKEGTGCNIVLGEEVRYATTENGQHVRTIHYHILYMKEHKNMGELAQDAIDVIARFQIEAWFARTNYQPAKDFLNTWNRGAYRKGVASFNPIDPPYVDERPDRGRIEYHVILVHELIRAHILPPPELEGTLLWPHLTGFKKDELLNSTDLEHPAVASLAYAATALKLRPTREEEIQEFREAEAVFEEIWGGDC